MLPLTITAHDGLSRAGAIQTAHGVIETPCFMAVGTLGAAKGVTPQQLLDHGAQALLMNAFHFAWRSGEELVKRLGGLHTFCGWPKPILTDSGGYQIFSLPELRKVTDEGAIFASAVNGDLRLFSPETVVDIECALAPDMAMVLDECPPFPCSPAELSRAVTRSIAWAQRAYARVKEVAPPVNFFGIVQGGCDEQERQRSLEATAAIPFAGFALGGFCVGEPIAETYRGIAFSAPKLPADKPRYLMGMGSPEDILLAVTHGIDLFDCTLPTRNGRNGLAYTSIGKVRIKNARHTTDSQPLDERCNCYTCRHFSRAFLRHLLLAHEMNAAILISLHNLAFYFQLMRDIRDAIIAGRLTSLRADCLSRWQAGAKEEI
ncbi:MAG: tRNA guanosine(34) transglycosylase Tgt [Planctomycetota bacterium]